MTTRRNAPLNIREEVVNVLLAEMLRSLGVPARAERRSREGTPDLRVELSSGDVIILECKWEGSESLLESQLDRRLEEFPEAVGLVGVVYPYWLREEPDTNQGLLDATDFQWWLHGSRGAKSPERRVREGTVPDLADHLRTLPFELEGVDRVAAAANAIGYALEQAAAQAAKHARHYRLIGDVIGRTDHEKDRFAARRIGLLVLFNALAFHQRLAEADESIPSLSECLAEGITKLSRVWNDICENIDYVPVFRLALDILVILGYGYEDYQRAVMAPLAKAVADTRRLEGHDLSGRLFHTLLSDAKFTGAYYTSIPAATLLARLVFQDWPQHVNWADHEFPGSLNVADLACGTGTLLMAVASEVERRHTEAGGRNAAELHKAMVEQALHGYDVQLSAVHFAATSLAMLNPTIQFDRMNLYVLPIGASGANVSLGSLDFLGNDETAAQFALSGGNMGMAMMEARRVYSGGSKGASQGVTARLPNLDLAIMNPPFTRSVGGNLLFGSLPAEQRKQLQKELSRRLKTRQATATAGLGAAFVAAASPRLRPGEGRLALVLPATVCTGHSWEPTRELVERDFTLDMVIASHDPLRWNFSDSTDLSEALLIATRRTAEEYSVERRTTFINLWQNPAGVLDAHRMAQAVARTTPARLEDSGAALLEIDGRHVGELVTIPESRLQGRKWSGIQFARADVVRSALRLLHDGEVWVPGEGAASSVLLCPMSELGQIGPDRRDLWDGFERTDAVTAYPMVENHDTEQRRGLLAPIDKYLAPLVEPRAGRRLKSSEQLWSRAGRLLVAERLRLDTARVVAMRSGVNVLSNVWWPVRVGNEDMEKALAAWLNSSLGLLTVLAQRTSTEGGWVAMKKADLEELPVLDVRRLPAQQLQGVAGLFDQLGGAEFERLPAMATCEARRALDDGISQILGLPDLATLRSLLSSEPVVSNRRL